MSLLKSVPKMVKERSVFPEFEPGFIEVGGLIPKFQYGKSLREEFAEGRLTEKLCIDLLKSMLVTRDFEEMIYDLRANNGKYRSIRFLYRGPTHLSIGQEAMSTGAIAAIHMSDYITSSHRGHGDALAKGYFAFREMNRDELVSFVTEDKKIRDHLEFDVEGKDSEQMRELALQLYLFRAIAELFGKETGFCRGRGGSMHIADFSVGHLGATAIVGGCLGIALGSGIASRYYGDNRVTLCFAGDGAYNNGIAHEALNMASMAQFTNGLMGKKYGVPTIFVVANNQYGMSGLQKGEVTGLDYLAERGFAYNKQGMHSEVVNGMDVLAVYDATRRAVEQARSGLGPILLELIGYRFKGHSLGDEEHYRTREEVEAWEQLDPIRNYSEKLVKEGILTMQELQVLKTQSRARNEEMARKAVEADDPDPEDVCSGIFSNKTTGEVPEEYTKARVIKEPDFTKRDLTFEISYREAVIEALYQEMRRDERVILWGEDIADYGGAFGATQGLLEIFGRDRIFNTPISESAIIGSGTGAAIRGLRPVVEIMYIDFLLQALDQLANHTAKWQYMTGGQSTMPLVVRTSVGGGKGYAGQHSQSLEDLLVHIPGLKIAVPSNAYDAKGMLISAIRGEDPVVFVEHQNLLKDPFYSRLSKSKVPKEQYLVPLGSAKIVKESTTLERQVTIVTYSYLVYSALKAAEHLSQDGIGAEVIDLRSLYPLDMDLVVRSVQKTHRAVVVHQSVSCMGLGAEIATQIHERAFDYLDSPVQRVAAPHCAPPSSTVLENAFLPNEQDIVEAAKKIV